MKRFLILALTSIATLAAVVPAAEAREGCGIGFHRGPYGGCRPDAAPGRVIVVPGGPQVGIYYRGRGYWDGHRYWTHRARYQQGWRYY